MGTIKAPKEGMNDGRTEGRNEGRTDARKEGRKEGRKGGTRLLLSENVVSSARDLLQTLRQFDGTQYGTLHGTLHGTHHGTHHGTRPPYAVFARICGLRRLIYIL